VHHRRERLGGKKSRQHAQRKTSMAKSTQHETSPNLKIRTTTLAAANRTRQSRPLFHGQTPRPGSPAQGARTVSGGPSAKLPSSRLDQKELSRTRGI
jgi:hypothetical protein